MDPRTAELHRLADQIADAGLAAPATILLAIVAPLDVVCSQGALFAQPLLRGTRWGAPLAALTAAESWPALRDLLAERR